MIAPAIISAGDRRVKNAGGLSKQSLEHGDAFFAGHPVNSGYRREWRKTLLVRHMIKRDGARSFASATPGGVKIQRDTLCDETSSLDSKSPVIKRQSDCGACQSQPDTLPGGAACAERAPPAARLLVELYCPDGIDHLQRCDARGTLKQ
jgi:hypothetical protein